MLLEEHIDTKLASYFIYNKQKEKIAFTFKNNLNKEDKNYILKDLIEKLLENKIHYKIKAMINETSNKNEVSLIVNENIDIELNH